MREFGTEALVFELTCATGTPLRAARVQSDVAVAINAALRNAGIEIAIPQRRLHLERSAADGLKPSSGAVAATRSGFQ